ncbi:MAG: hypothetical protein JSW11_15020 [Candidatus Heimdallarchaeota archaeon]|nr:MAG: hypothetical protein JSW11_15020 [Candidatus Heimdallarchaeota archaeon]
MFFNQIKHQGCIFFLLCVLIISSGGCLQAFARAIQEEWQIQVGDSQTYIYDDFYEVSSDNSSEYIYWIIDENNNNVTIILKKGLTLRYDITFLDPDEARGTITYNGTITSLEQSLSSRTYSGWTGIVRPSINNKSYWEEYCRFRGLENVTGDFIVMEINTDIINQISIWNWKTGWLNYYYEMYWNDTTIISLREISLVPQENEPPPPLNVIVGGFILVFIILILVGIKKFK